MSSISLHMLEVRTVPPQTTSSLNGASDASQDSDNVHNEGDIKDAEARGKEVMYQKDMSRGEFDCHLNPQADGHTFSDLRVFFLNTRTVSTPSGKPHFPGIFGRAPPQQPIDNNDDSMTIEHLINTLGVHPKLRQNFLPGALWLSGTGNALYKTWATAAGAVSSIEGFYRYSMMNEDGLRDFRVRVWFHHDLEGRSSKYIVHNLPEKHQDTLKELAEKQLTCGHGVGYQADWQAMSIDCLIVEMVADSWKNRIDHVFKTLVAYEQISLEEYNEKRLSAASLELHTLAQNIHVMQEEMYGNVEKIKFLVDICGFLSVPPCASIFSMAFFDKGPSQSLSVTKDVWLYPVIAIPFTLFTIFVWFWWRKREIKSAFQLSSLIDADLGRANFPGTTLTNGGPRVDPHHFAHASPTYTIITLHSDEHSSDFRVRIPSPDST
ncbi:hypothetical protein EST38_g5498 [Candolleomyces aberdarensis]|uniref:Uncharacterized protein n=1 Tax=Candolleomyces aberdarensis TaxID=2316362 RepID=A0A4Q2DNI6_9AGAR|nr:hypothetical protein EST38_g5498 [Candolleomyces aberdarensis]